MKNHIIILNGPPGSGKDAIADWLKRFEHEHLTFKEPIFNTVLQLTGMSAKEWFERYDNRDLKEKPWSKICGMSCRDLMIHVSENVIKKIHGQEYYGKVMAKKIESGKNYVFSDGGFTPEIAALATAKRLSHSIYIARIFRQGCDFGKDSRGFVNHKDITGVKGFGVINYEGDALGTAIKITSLVKEGYSEG